MDVAEHGVELSTDDTAARPRVIASTPRQALIAFETGRCGVAPATEPSEADGRALGAMAAASLGTGGRGVLATSRLAAGGSCVHHLVGEGPSSRACQAPFELVAADVGDTLLLASAARAISEAGSVSVICRVPDALVDRVGLLTPAVPAPSAPPAAGTPWALAAGALASHGLLSVSREGQGTTAIVAAGAEVPLARSLAARLRAVGTDCAVIVLRALAPFPGRTLRTALDGVDSERLLVLDESARPGRLARNVGLALGHAPSVLTAGSDGPAWLGAALDVEEPEAAPCAWNVAPAGGWAHAVLLSLAAHSGANGPAAGGGQWVESAGHSGVLWSGEGMNLAVAAAPHLVEPALVQGADAVLVGLCEPAQLAAAIDARSLDALDGARVWCLSGEATPDRMVAALSAIRAGSAEASVPGLVLSADLRAAVPEVEVDFRPGRALPLVPAASGELDLEPWFSFHRMGPAGDLVPRARPISLAAAELGRAFAEEPGWPAVRLADGTVTPLASVLASSAGDLSSRVPEVVWRADEALEAGADVDLRGLIRAASSSLVASMDASEAAKTELAAAFESLAAALPSGTVERLDASTPVRWAVQGMTAARADARAELRQGIRLIVDGLSERLLLEDLDSETGRSPERVGASLGDASRFFDAGALAGTLAPPAHDPLDPGRRARMDAALAVLQAWLASEPTVHVVAADRDVQGLSVLRHPDPLGAAVGVFEALAGLAVDVARAWRTATLELADDWAESHEAALAALDWQGLRTAEMPLLPDVLVLTDGARLRSGGLGALSGLLRSSRPVRVLVLDGADDVADPSRYHAGLGWLGVAHREAGVLESSAADPVELAAGLAALLPSWRPVMLVVRAVDGAAAAELARVGRAWPELLYVPDAGASWAERLTLDGNPCPPEAWPRVVVEAVDADGGDVVIDAPCTFADAVAAGPAFGGHLRALPPEAWSDPALVPLDVFVQDFDPDRRVRELPWVWTLEPGRVIGRAVVSRGLALACRDRARAWKQLQELAGHGDVWAERAAAAERERAEADASARIAELESLHAAALATVAEDAVGQAMDRLAASLLSIDGSLVAAPPARSAPAPAPGSVDTPAPAEAAAPAPVEEDDDVLVSDDPYVDAFLCTTCNECTNINGELFVYNKDKQAEIADPSKGTFAELVKAAEVCPATCIHPGKPRAGDATATPDLVARAAAFS